MFITILLAGVAAASAAAAPPSGSVLASLRDASRHSVAVVWSDAGRFELLGARFDSAGVWADDRAIRRPPRTAIIQAGAADGFAAPPRPIAWDRVDSIAVTRHGAGPVRALVATAGMTFAVGIPLAILSLHGSEHPASSTNAAALAITIPVALGGMATASALAGRDRTRVVYRAR